MVGTVGRNRICLATTCGLLIGGIATSRFRRYLLLFSTVCAGYTAYRSHSQFMNRKEIKDWTQRYFRTQKAIASAKQTYNFSTSSTETGVAFMRDQHHAFHIHVQHKFTSPATGEMKKHWSAIDEYVHSIQTSKIPDVITWRQEVQKGGYKEWVERLRKKWDDEVFLEYVRDMLTTLSTEESNRLLQKLNYTQRVREVGQALRSFKFWLLDELCLETFKPDDAKYLYHMEAHLAQLKTADKQPLPNLDTIKQKLAAAATPIKCLVKLGESILALDKGHPLTFMDKVKGAFSVLIEKDYKPSFLR